MFEVRSLQDAVKPLSFISTVLGLASPRQRNGRTIYFILHHFYNSAIFFLHCFSGVIIINSALKLFSIKESEGVSLTIFTLVTYATTLTAMLTSSKNIRHNILRNIERVDYIFTKNALHNYRNIRKCLLGIILFCSLWVMIELVMYSTKYWKNLAVFYLVYYVNTIVAIDSALMVMLLYSRFKQLNEKLLAIVECRYSDQLDSKYKSASVYGRKKYLVSIPTNLTQGLWLKNSMLVNGTITKSYFPNCSEDHEDRLNTLKCLRKIHRHLVKVAECINNNHGVLYLVLVLESVICTVVAIFKIFQMVKLRADIMILSVTSAVVRSLLKTSSISFACEWTCNEARRTGAILQDLILEEEELIPSLHHFSEQLKHTRVQFSACGFFRMGGSTMAAVIASVVTYSIIVIQFLLSENSTT